MFQHASLESLLRALSRNPALPRARGFNPLPIQRKPKAQIVTDPETGLTHIDFPPVSEPVQAAPTSWKRPSV